MDLSGYRYEKKLVAFVDILGFRNKTQLTTSDAKKPVHSMLAQIREYIKDIKKNSTQDIQGGRYYVFSDSSLYSADKVDFNKLVSVIMKLQFLAATEGFFFRGGLTYGEIYDENEFFYGKGLNRAYEMESKVAIYPRIVIDKNNGLIRSKANKIYLKQDFDGLYFINFLKKLPEDDCCYNENNVYSEENYRKIREHIQKEIEANKTNLYVLMKFGWVAKYFNNFIEEEHIDCEKVNFSDFMIGK